MYPAKNLDRRFRNAIVGTLAVATLGGAVAVVAASPTRQTTTSTATEVAPPDDAAVAPGPTTGPTATPSPTATDSPASDSPASDSAGGPAALSDAVIDEPADEIDEPDAPGNAGEVTGDDLPADPPPAPAPSGPVELQPVPKTPPPAPVPDPIDLLDFDPDPTPPGPNPAVPTVGNLQVATANGVDDLASNFTGCALKCVEQAILTPNLQTPNLALAVETTVPARIDIRLTNQDTDGELYISSNTFKTEWNTVLGPLEEGTPYHLLFEAYDEEDQKQVYTHEFVSTARLALPDTLAGNESGCALQCIIEGVVNHTDSFDTVEVHVETDTPAVLRAYVSTAAPGWVGDTPLMPAESEVTVSPNLSTSWTFDVGGLAAETVYHVVVKATDDDGQTAFQVGQFTTDEEQPVDVLVTFRQIFVQWDGDKSGVNRGELSFAWGFDGTPIGFRGEEKMDGGTIINLSSHNAQWFSLSNDGVLPKIMVRGTERDWDGLVELCAQGTGIPSQPVYSPDCDSKTNVAQTGHWTLADIEELPACAAIGFEGAGIFDRCASIFTPDAGDDYAKFQVIVTFSINE